MPKRVAVSTLNASTLDILNVIRQNASAEYQELVPKVASAKDIPRVGEVLQGYPAMANQFLAALVNRIAAVRVKSATFNNPYAHLKKGFLEFGETVEEIFVGIAKVRTFDVEKAEQRELKRSLPDVRSAFHIMNWRVQYPVTIQEEDLTTAFLSMEGVQDLIAKIVDQAYTAAEYDEYLLFKYLIIKAVSGGKMKPIAIGNGTDLQQAAVTFRGTSNQITFMSTEYNEAGVRNNTPRSRQAIFMDSTFNASYDVNVLAASFHMEKADFMGRLHLIDSFTTFDNERFEEIMANSDMIEQVTADELALMRDVKAVLIDEDWFQVYDNKQKFTEKYVASGMYWNYFYNVWKTISHSPFHNAIVLVTDNATITAPASITGEIVDKSVGENATVLTIDTDLDTAALSGGNVNFVQTQAATQAGIAIHKYGAVIYPPNAANVALEVTAMGETYRSPELAYSTANVGDQVTFSKV